MSRARIVRVGILNIVTHPHTAENYADQFKSGAKLGRERPLSTDFVAKIVSCHTVDESNPQSLITGEVFRYFDLDPEKDWFNVESGELATEDDLEKISIPDELKPHLQRIRYVFFPAKHRMVFVVKSAEGGISPERMKKFIEQTFNDPTLAADNFPHASVSIVQEESVLEEILALPLLQRIRIEVNRPNADADDDDADIMKELEREKASTKIVELQSQGAESIEPDGHTKKLARVAVENGSVEARGRNEQNQAVYLKTKESPKIEIIKVLPSQAILETILEESRKIVENRKRE